MIVAQKAQTCIRITPPLPRGIGHTMQEGGGNGFILPDVPAGSGSPVLPAVGNEDPSLVAPQVPLQAQFLQGASTGAGGMGMKLRLPCLLRGLPPGTLVQPLRSGRCMWCHGGRCGTTWGGGGRVCGATAPVWHHMGATALLPREGGQVYVVLRPVWHHMGSVSEKSGSRSLSTLH